MLKRFYQYCSWQVHIHVYRLHILQAQFYEEEEFCHYNMFNHHFFEEHSHDTFTKFIAEPDFGKLVLVTDPPFGGRVEVLAHVIKKISAAYQATPHARE